VLRLFVSQLVDDVFDDGVGIGKYPEDNVAPCRRAYGDIARDHCARCQVSDRPAFQDGLYRESATRAFAVHFDFPLVRALMTSHRIRYRDRLALR